MPGAPGTPSMNALDPPVSVLAGVAPGVVPAVVPVTPVEGAAADAADTVAPPRGFVLVVPLIGALPVTLIPVVPPRFVVGPPKPPGAPAPPRPAATDPEPRVPLNPDVVPGVPKFTTLVFARFVGLWL